MGAHGEATRVISVYLPEGPAVSASAARGLVGGSGAFGVWWVTFLMRFPGLSVVVWAYVQDSEPIRWIYIQEVFLVYFSTISGSLLRAWKNDPGWSPPRAQKFGVRRSTTRLGLRTSSTEYRTIDDCSVGGEPVAHTA